MEGAIAEAIIVAALLLGLLASFVPGFPGSAIALLGVVAYAELDGPGGVGPDAQRVAAMIALAGVGGQWVGPVLSVRAAGGPAGAATGAGLGAVIGALTLVPGVPWALAVVGAVIGAVVGSAGAPWGARVRGPIGAGAGCVIAVLCDLIAVLGIAGVLAVATAAV